jgi:hypothetical protein
MPEVVRFVRAAYFDLISSETEITVNYNQKGAPTVWSAIPPSQFASIRAIVSRRFKA